MADPLQSKPPIESIDSDAFKSIFQPGERAKVASTYDATVQRWQQQLNYNFFRAPQNYDPYDRFLGDTHAGLELLPDLSRPNMSSLYFLRQLGGDHIVLDYACGISGYLHYAQRFFPTYGFDRWIQVPREVCVEFLSEFSIEPSILIDLDEIAAIKPTVINVAGYWIEDLSLYELASVQYILSDTLYNSGSVPDEGVHHYQENWQDTPDRHGYSLVHRLPCLDIFKRSESQ